MNKILLFLILFIFSFYETFSQYSENAIGAVQFSYYHVLDSLIVSDTYTADMTLFFGKKITLFESPTKREFDSLKKVQTISGSLSNAVGLKPLPPRTITSLMYRLYNDNKFIIVENELKNYLMEDNLSITHWKLDKDSVKIIAGITCYKATGNFRGRTYIVWYTPSIPISGGPWKLGGLPGLILEAYDTKREVVFSCKAIQHFVNPVVVTIEVPNDCIKTTITEYNKLKEAIAIDPFTYMKNTMGITMEKPANFRPRSTKSKNPLELTEQ
ncbi:MAG: GLPGLI family protein [Bacteroidetes bacterium]|nr:GLPGLI family protein [Bacteroidota bacterium]